MFQPHLPGEGRKERSAACWGGRGHGGRGGIDTDACFLTERAIIKLERVRVLIACMLLTRMNGVLSALLRVPVATCHPKWVMSGLVCVSLLKGFKQITKLQCVMFPFHVHEMFGLDTESHMSESSFKFG